MSRNIELVRYRRFGDDLLLLDLLTAVSTGAAPVTSDGSSPAKVNKYKINAESLAGADLTNLYADVESFMLGLGDDVVQKTLRFYFAFKRIKNFACVEVTPQINVIRLYLKVTPTSENITEGFTRDVRDVGHFGTGDLEVTVKNHEDFERAKPLILQSYEAS